MKVNKDLQPVNTIKFKNNHQKERNYNVNFGLNTYILQCLVAGVSMRSMYEMLRFGKLDNAGEEKSNILDIMLDLRIQKACNTLTLSNLHQRIRMIHECCFQYLVGTGLCSLLELQYYDLLGLDNPLIQLDWMESSGLELKFRSVVNKHFITIY